MSHQTKEKFEPWNIIHISAKTKQLTHIYTRDDMRRQKERVEHCIEIDEVKVNFAWIKKCENRKEEAIQITNETSDTFSIKVN